MYRVGCDICAIERIRRACENRIAGFPRRVFSDQEIAEARERADEVTYFATRFAGKEAVFKALDLPEMEVRLEEIEILARGNGRPSVTLLGHLREVCTSRGVRDIDLSLSNDTDYAMAVAIAEIGSAISGDGMTQGKDV